MVAKLGNRTVYEFTILLFIVIIITIIIIYKCALEHNVC